MELVRLRIEIDSVDVEFTRNIEARFWYLLDKGQLKSIEAFRRHLVSRICYIKATSGNKNIKLPGLVRLSLDGFELPCQETTCLLRDQDKIVPLENLKRKLLDQLSDAPQAKKSLAAELESAGSSLTSLTSNSQKRKLSAEMLDATLVKKPTEKELSSTSELLSDWDADQIATENSPVKRSMQHYTACLIGTSMVKHLNFKELFPDNKCFFKAVSGGSIKNVLQCLRARSNVLTDCQVFVITAGCNDLDRDKPGQSASEDFLTLCRYLKETYPNARFIVNKLVPRTTTKYTDLHVFEQRRADFNLFLDNQLQFLGDYVVVTHAEFEKKQELWDLLSDGVHLSPMKGVPLYTAEIKKFL